jgi:hypothetical protein
MGVKIACHRMLCTQDANFDPDVFCKCEHWTSVYVRTSVEDSGFREETRFVHIVHKHEHFIYFKIYCALLLLFLTISVPGGTFNPPNTKAQTAIMPVAPAA